MKDFLAKMKEFIKTPLGKVALVAVVLLVIIFLAAFLVGIFLLFNNLRGEPKESVKTPVKVEKSTESSTTVGKSTKEAEAGRSEEGEESETFELYEYKDPFEPLIKGATTTTPTTQTPEEETPTSPEEPPTGPQILEVQDIYTESGVKYSSVKYGTTVYKVKEGDRVNESPYEVLTIGTDSVTFLYGDRRVEVKVGESILK